MGAKHGVLPQTGRSRQVRHAFSRKQATCTQCRNPVNFFLFLMNRIFQLMPEASLSHKTWLSQRGFLFEKKES
jgi:hypothetical protein